MVTMDPSLKYFNSFTENLAMALDEVNIELMSPNAKDKIAELIRRNLEQFSDSQEVLAASFRRLEDLAATYSKEGCRLFIAKNPAISPFPIGCAGLGPLKGLPLSEGIGEIRDLVVDLPFRGKGLGSRLLHRCISEAKALGYQRLYLETSKNMIQARKLFLRTGFRPVTENHGAGALEMELPSYFLMENLQQA